MVQCFTHENSAIASSVTHVIMTETESLTTI